MRPMQQYQMEMQPLSRPYNSGQYNNYYDEEEDSDYDEADAGPKKRNGACSPLVCLGIGCGGCCCCMILVLLIVGIVGGFLFVKAPRKWGWMEGVSACNKYWCSLSDGPFLTPQNITKYLRWAGVPAAQIVGLKSDALLNTSGPNCYPGNLVSDMDTYNTAMDWALVSFNSRAVPGSNPELVQLKAWWMPTDVARRSTAPTIVVQHGLGSSNNGRMPQYSAYLLRSMGFNVLAASFRDHGLSGESNQKKHTTWGYVYPYDLLGAWDYAVSDPEGKLAGPRPPAQVGIMGFSMGAMTAATAFGLEPRIPGAWLDSAPWTPRSVLDGQLKSKLGPFRYPFVAAAWWGANMWAGVDLHRFIPKNALSATCSASYQGNPRHVAELGSTLDTLVPISEVDEMIDFFSGLPNCYDVTLVYTPPSSCHGNPHAQEMYEFSDIYRAENCKFWAKVFGLTIDYCGLINMPHYKISYQETMKILGV